MKCANHPGREAVGRCAHCRKPLCDECATEEARNTYTCLVCAAAVAAQDAVLGIRRRVEAQEERALFRECKKPLTYLRIFIPVSVLTGLIIAGINVYFRVTPPSSGAFDPAQDPLASIVIVDQAIREYARNHYGQVPEDLQALQRKVTGSKGLKATIINDVIYIRKSPTTYEIRSRRSGTKGVPDFTITDRGIE